MAKRTFGTAVNCMDGRTQEIAANIVRSAAKVDYIDAVTDPGPVRILTSGNPAAIGRIRTGTDISVNNHGSRFILVVGHDDCAGNPTDEATQRGQIAKSAKLIQSWYPDNGVTVVGLWVDKDLNGEVLVGSEQHNLPVGKRIYARPVEILPLETISTPPKATNTGKGDVVTG
jgi:hypothetical protein